MKSGTDDLDFRSHFQHSFVNGTDSAVSFFRKVDSFFQLVHREVRASELIYRVYSVILPGMLSSQFSFDPYMKFINVDFHLSQNRDNIHARASAECYKHKLFGAGPFVFASSTLIHVEDQLMSVETRAESHFLIPGYIDHHENFVFVGDVVKGHILANEKGRVGERYLLGGENLSIREFLDLLEDISGIRAPKLRFPYFPALLAGYLYEALARITRTPPPFTVGFVKETRTDMRCDISKAKRDLGYETTPIRDAIRASVEWLRKNGYAP